MAGARETAHIVSLAEEGVCCWSTRGTGDSLTFSCCLRKLQRGEGHFQSLQWGAGGTWQLLRIGRMERKDMQFDLGDWSTVIPLDMCWMSGTPGSVLIRGAQKPVSSRGRGPAPITPADILQPLLPISFSASCFLLSEFV